MTALHGVDVRLELKPFLELEGEALRHERSRQVAAWAVEEARGVVAPALVYEWLHVEVVGGTQIRVADTVFRLGHHAELMIPAREVFVCVVTIGAALEERARELSAEGRAFESFILGEVGVFAVGNLIEEGHRLVEGEAAARGWGVGAELAPGQLAGWDTAEQKLLCALLDVASIGVSVTPSGMLVPQKSASIIVGIGPDYGSSTVSSPCAYCAQAETCRYRH